MKDAERERKEEEARGLSFANGTEQENQALQKEQK